MKLWVLTVLMLVLICLTIPFVTAEDKPKMIRDGKVMTPAQVELKPVDSLAPIKQVIGLPVDTRIEVVINGARAAILPEGSPIIEVTVTEECIHIWPYGTLQWYNCEGGV